MTQFRILTPRTYVLIYLVFLLFESRISLRCDVKKFSFVPFSNFICTQTLPILHFGLKFIFVSPFFIYLLKSLAAVVVIVVAVASAVQSVSLSKCLFSLKSHSITQVQQIYCNHEHKILLRKIKILSTRTYFINRNLWQ